MCDLFHGSPNTFLGIKGYRHTHLYNIQYAVTCCYNGKHHYLSEVCSGIGVNDIPGIVHADMCGDLKRRPSVLGFTRSLVANKEDPPFSNLTYSGRQALQDSAGGQIAVLQTQFPDSSVIWNESKTTFCGRPGLPQVLPL